MAGRNVRWKKLTARGCSGVKKSAVKLLAAVVLDLRGDLGSAKEAPNGKCLGCENWGRPMCSMRQKGVAGG